MSGKCSNLAIHSAGWPCGARRYAASRVPGGTVAAATWDTRGGFVSHRTIFDTAAMLDRSGNDRRALVYTSRLLKFGFSQLYPAFETGSVVLVECH